MNTLIAPPLLLMMALIPAINLMVPRLTRPDLFFSITVDPSLRQSEAGREILHRFDAIVIGSSILGLALAVAGAFANLGFAPSVSLMIGGGVVESTGFVMAYARARRQVRPHQVEPSREREVMVRPRSMRPVGGWLGQAGPFLVLGAAALFLWWKWDAIPARFPIHWDLYGRPNGWAVKSWRSVFGTMLIGVLTCLFLSFLMNGLARGVRRIHSSGLDGERESRFLKTMLLMILGLEYWLAGTLGFSPVLPLWLSAVLVVAGLVVGIAVTIVALRSGQGGWRLHGQDTASAPGHPQAPAGDRTPDDCWKWGLIYRNPADPALWVEKRFGIGWTLNFGNPRAWILLIAMVLFSVGVIVISTVLVRK